MNRTTTLHRGLTFLEVLIATAILAVIASVVAPMIARAMASLSQAPSASRVEVTDLGVLADAFTDKPDRFGYSGAPLHTLDHFQITWADKDKTSSMDAPVTITSLRDTAPNADHLWLRFECEQATVMRWVAIPPPYEQEQPRP